MYMRMCVRTYSTCVCRKYLSKLLNMTHRLKRSNCFSNISVCDIPSHYEGNKYHVHTYLCISNCIYRYSVYHCCRFVMGMCWISLVERPPSLSPSLTRRTPAIWHTTIPICTVTSWYGLGASNQSISSYNSVSTGCVWTHISILCSQFFYLKGL